MLNQRLLLASSNSGPDIQDYSGVTWDLTRYFHILSNGNRTVNICSVANLAVTGSIYVEILCLSGDFGDQYCGLVPNSITATHISNGTVPTGSIRILQSHRTLQVYGISFNAKTGAYKIKRANTVVAEGISPDLTLRPYALMFTWSTPLYATIRIPSEFSYTPEYV